jgi:SAM-dependent methyltransferase
VAHSGPSFYDDPAVFATYMRSRARDETPNDTLERPDLWDLIGEVAGNRVLDLGCGDAQIGRELLAAGAATYLGVDPSDNMVRAGRATLAGSAGQITQATIEGWSYTPATFDLVISRLALHYVEDLPATFRQVFGALSPGGRVVFSVEHPVITSCNRALDAGGQRQAWIVDDYHVQGRRETHWLGGEVVKYHRTVDGYVEALLAAGFMLKALREASPRRAAFLRDETYRRRLRIPLFLVLAGHKPA